ncbi:MAG: protein-L-isoaspartate O-methyltransferase, partial [Humidesulfovibrio sp.]|nr:protein-L-isoaspartate O-methyltransferase [Humidesulfovibrio sp.]
IFSGFAATVALALGLVWGTGLYMAYWPGAAISPAVSPADSGVVVSSRAVSPVQPVDFVPPVDSVPPVASPEAFASSEASASAAAAASSRAQAPAPVQAASSAPVATAPAQAAGPAAAPAGGRALAEGEGQASPVPGNAAAAAGIWSHGAPWDFKAYTEAMRQSGRSTELSEKDFSELQTRKVVAMQAIESYLARRFGKADPNVLRAFRELPREYYQYDYQQKRAFAAKTYEAAPKPWAIGFGSALSDYLGQAYMTQLCRPRPGDTVLEIGTGSGFQSSLLSRMVKDVYSIEIIKPLGTEVARIYKPLGLDNVRTRVGDGYFGWPEVQGGFDIIMVTCVARYVSPELLKQLKPEGRLIVPIGQPFKRGQVLYVFSKDKAGKVHSRKDVGVYFIPMTGRIMEGKP